MKETIEFDVIKENVEKDFYFLRENPIINTIILYGSVATQTNHKMSDIDICIVASDQEKIFDVWSFIMENIEVDVKKYDIHFFRELPLYIKWKIMEEGIVIYAKDLSDLSMHFYHFRKLYSDWKFRMDYCI